MNSMTGFGKGIASSTDKKITIEIKTVNHRYLDYNIKMPRNFLFLEDTIKKTIEQKISRGHLDIFLTYEKTGLANGQFVLDEELANNYIQIARDFSNKSGLTNDLTITNLFKVPDILSRDIPIDDEEELSNITKNALNDALNNLVIMRENEGSQLKSDLLLKLDNIEKSLNIIKELAPNVVKNYQEQLLSRIDNLISPTLVDQQRLATEVALFADHCAIDEEIQRLGTHILNMRKLFNSKEPIGRKLDFLVQELNRETNTIGSKANDLNITNEVLFIKNEIEKIREQSANIE